MTFTALGRASPDWLWQLKRDFASSQGFEGLSTSFRFHRVPLRGLDLPQDQVYESEGNEYKDAFITFLAVPATAFSQQSSIIKCKNSTSADILHAF